MSIRLTPSLMAKARALWLEGKNTWEIANELNKNPGRSIGVSEPDIYNQLTEIRGGAPSFKLVKP